MSQKKMAGVEPAIFFPPLHVHSLFHNKSSQLILPFVGVLHLDPPNNIVTTADPGNTPGYSC